MLCLLVVTKLLSIGTADKCIPFSIKLRNQSINVSDVSCNHNSFLQDIDFAWVNLFPISEEFWRNPTVQSIKVITYGGSPDNVWYLLTKASGFLSLSFSFVCVKFLHSERVTSVLDPNHRPTIPLELIRLPEHRYTANIQALLEAVGIRVRICCFSDQNLPFVSSEAIYKRFLLHSLFLSDINVYKYICSWRKEAILWSRD